MDFLVLIGLFLALALSTLAQVMNGTASIGNNTLAVITPATVTQFIPLTSVVTITEALTTFTETCTIPGPAITIAGPAVTVTETNCNCGTQTIFSFAASSGTTSWIGNVSPTSNASSTVTLTSVVVVTAVPASSVEIITQTVTESSVNVLTATVVANSSALGAGATSGPNGSTEVPSTITLVSTVTQTASVVLAQPSSSGNESIYTTTSIIGTDTIVVTRTRQTTVTMTAGSGFLTLVYGSPVWNNSSSTAGADSISPTSSYVPSAAPLSTNSTTVAGDFITRSSSFLTFTMTPLWTNSSTAAGAQSTSPSGNSSNTAAATEGMSTMTVVVTITSHASGNLTSSSASPSLPAVPTNATSQLPTQSFSSSTTVEGTLPPNSSFTGRFTSLNYRTSSKFGYLPFIVNGTLVKAHTQHDTASSRMSSPAATTTSITAAGVVPTTTFNSTLAAGVGTSTTSTFLGYPNTRPSF